MYNYFRISPQTSGPKVTLWHSTQLYVWPKNGPVALRGLKAPHDMTLAVDWNVNRENKLLLTPVIIFFFFRFTFWKQKAIDQVLQCLVQLCDTFNITQASANLLQNLTILGTVKLQNRLWCTEFSGSWSLTINMYTWFCNMHCSVAEHADMSVSCLVF